jgi:hypothetical protein
MYIEVTLPDPSADTGQESIRKEIKKADGTVTFEGKRVLGWQNGAEYTYVARIYSDPEYKTLIGIHAQPMRCVKPPESILSRLKEP